MIQIFAKAPSPGQVKTRLIPALGVVGATRLYRRMLRRTLDTVLAADCAPVQLRVPPPLDHPELTELASHYQVPLVAQQGADLGQRMAQGAREALLHHDCVVLIGTDCPLLTPGYLRQAIDLLGSGTRVVIGPAEDGGYVLLGLNTWSGELFRDIDWGSERVLRQTLERVDALAWDYGTLPPLWDVDRIEDVLRLSDVLGPDWAIAASVQGSLRRDVTVEPG